MHKLESKRQGDRWLGWGDPLLGVCHGLPGVNHLIISADSHLVLWPKIVGAESKTRYKHKGTRSPQTLMCHGPSPAQWNVLRMSWDLIPSRWALVIGAGQGHQRSLGTGGLNAEGFSSCQAQ